LARGIVRFRVDFTRRSFGHNWSGSISPRWWASTNFMASTRSCPKLGFFEDWLIQLPVCRNRRRSFCDADCDAAPGRMGGIGRCCTGARQCSTSSGVTQARARPPLEFKTFARTRDQRRAGSPLQPHPANSHAEGHRFESCRAHHHNKSLSQNSRTRLPEGRECSWFQRSEFRTRTTAFLEPVARTTIILTGATPRSVKLN
jgi:hypothetical protein